MRTTRLRQKNQEISAQQRRGEYDRDIGARQYNDEARNYPSTTRERPFQGQGHHEGSNDKERGCPIWALRDLRLAAKARGSRRRKLNSDFQIYRPVTASGKAVHFGTVGEGLLAFLIRTAGPSL